MSDSKVERIDVEYVVLDDKLLESRDQRLFFNDKKILIEGDVIEGGSGSSTGSVGLIRNINFKTPILF